MERLNNPSDYIAQRISLGPDASLLELFGYNTQSDKTTGISELRKYVLETGFFITDEIEPEGMIAIEDHEEIIYPAFQFDTENRQPLPVVLTINNVLLSDDEMRPWEAAMWWCNENGYLDGRVPYTAIGTY